ncbi:DUF2950 family protein [Cupriavidus necator]|nr:DUF2950 family protein [Cupriavidus necator]
MRRMRQPSRHTLLIPPVGAEVRYKFLEAWSQSHMVRPDGADRTRIAAGKDGWTLPIPLVKTSKGSLLACRLPMLSTAFSDSWPNSEGESCLFSYLETSTPKPRMRKSAPSW